MSASPTQRRTARSREASNTGTRRSRRRFALERLEERTLLAGGITGFNNGVGWTGNNNGTGGPAFTANTLVLTNGVGQARSAFNNTLQPTNGPWTASFTYTPQTIDDTIFADGVTFMLQNQGPTALGPGGSGLGMAGITPSAEVEFNIYNAHVIGTAFETDGANSQVYMSTGAVDIASGDPIGVMLSYSGTTLTEKLTDLTTSATFSTSFTINLQSVLGLSASLVGFTGATGDGESVQTISDFSFSGSPSTTLTGTAGNEIAGVEGSSTGTVQLGTFTDADQSSTAADYTTPPGSVVVNWGDGSAPQTLAASNLTPIGTPNGVVWQIDAAHTYTEEGTYAYTVTVTDVDGAATTVDGSAIIADAPLTAGTPVALVGNTGVQTGAGSLPSTTIVGTFTDGNTFATTADYRATIDWGGGSPFTTGTVVATATPGVFDVEGGHIYAKAGDYTTKITVIDDGGSQVVIPGTAVITDLPVTQLGPNSSFTAIEGLPTPLFVMATFEDPNTLATVSNVNATLGIGGWGDGTPAAAGVELKTELVGVDPTNLEPIFQVLGSHTYAEETPTGSPHTTTVVVTTLGAAGFATTTFHGSVTVVDAGLTGSGGGEITGVEGSSTGSVLLGTFVDSNQAATVADFTAGGGSVVVNWGDGSAPQTLPASDITSIGSPNGVSWNVDAAHTYAEEGFFAYKVTVTDVGGAATTITGSAVIADAPLAAGAAVHLTTNTGVALSSVEVGSFTDGNPTAPITDFKATIDWGDGSPNSIGTISQPGGVGTAFEVLGTHIYAKPGAFVTTINVTDVGGSAVTITGSATVTDLAVTGTTGNFTATEGINTGLFVLATFTDPNTLATVADVNAQLAIGGWGDTTPTTAGVTLVVQQIGVTPLTAANNPGDPIFEVLGSHTYKEETPAGLPDTLSVIITTLGGTPTTLTSPPGGGVTVLDAQITSSNGTEITGLEGSPTAGPAAGTLLGTFTDANQGSTVADFTTAPGSTVVNWGDGSAPQTLLAANLTAVGSPNGVIYTINAAHTYAEEGTYAYSVTVTDDGGAVTILSGSAIIADAPLSPSATQPIINTTETPVFPVPQFGKPVFYNQPVASFIDANASAPLSDFTATIDWGDGTALSAGTVTQPGGIGTAFVVTGSHTYADAGVNGGVGTYPVQVFITDVGGSRLTVTNIANVADRAIVLTGQLNPASDSGLSTGTVDTTNVKQPDFSGSSEAFSHVTLFATLTGGGPLVQIAQVQAGSDGSWNAVSSVPLADGSYVITATAVDQFGETTTTSPTTITSNLVIDTVGPVITNVVWNRLNGQVDYVIQDPSPGSGVDVASLMNSANYEFTKVHANKAFPGKWIVTNIGVTPGAAPSSYDVAVTFNDGATIRGGFYIFTIRDSSNGDSSVQDLAENHLDGVFYGTFPSGNGVNGSDFVTMLSGFHNKIFSPQSLVGTASAGNNGVGGERVGAVHSGNFTPVIPRGGSPVFDADPSAAKSRKVAKLHTGAKLHKAPAHHAAAAHHAKARTGNHPHGPLHS